jgi:thiol-disulfide isomerase/thioredoxin
MGSPAPAIDRRHFLSAAAGLILLAISPVLLAQGYGMTPVAGKPEAPGLRLPDVDGKTVDIAGYRGRVVLVNFWASWCPPCRKEFPSLDRVRKAFKPTELEVLAVNVGEDAETAFSFAGMADFPVLLDRDSKAMGAWSVMGLPTTLLVDREGKVAFRAVGGREFDDPEIIALIRSLL